MRLREGEALERELCGRLSGVLALVEALEARSGDVVAAARERICKRADQLREELGNLDEARLYQEVAIAADRLDVTEELVRLHSHVEQFGDVLDGADAETPCGRRLDFPLQEMMREANTVGSKANDAPLAHFVVDLKTEVERIRKQVQNAEKTPPQRDVDVSDDRTLRLLNIGYGNLVMASRVVAIVSPQSAPMRRLREEAAGRGKLLDTTQGRRTRSILLTDSDLVILSAINPETIASRLSAEDETR